MNALQTEILLGLYLALGIYGLIHYLRCRKAFFDACDEIKRRTGQRHPKDFRPEVQMRIYKIWTNRGFEVCRGSHHVIFKDDVSSDGPCDCLKEKQ